MLGLIDDFMNEGFNDPAMPLTGSSGLIPPLVMKSSRLRLGNLDRSKYPFHSDSRSPRVKF